MSIDFGNGITITSSFDMTAQKPLDSRMKVDTYSDLAKIPNSYVGLTVFVTSEGKLYIKRSASEWKIVDGEVTTKSMTSAQVKNLNFGNIPAYMLQKEEKNFFPIISESHIYDSSKKTPISSSLQTTNKTIAGAINEVNSKLATEIDNFKKTSQAELDKLTGMVNGAQDELDTKMTEIDKQMATLQKQITDAEKELSDTIEEVKKDAKEQIDKEVTTIKEDVEAEISAITNNVSNVILTTKEINDFMKQINANLTAAKAI